MLGYGKECSGMVWYDRVSKGTLVSVTMVEKEEGEVEGEKREEEAMMVVTASQLYGMVWYGMVPTWPASLSSSSTTPEEEEEEEPCCANS